MGSLLGEGAWYEWRRWAISGRKVGSEASKGGGALEILKDSSTMLRRLPLVLWPGQSLPEVFLLSVFSVQAFKSHWPTSWASALGWQTQPEPAAPSSKGCTSFSVFWEKASPALTPPTLLGTHFPLSLPSSHYRQPVSGAILDLSEPSPLPSPAQPSGTAPGKLVPMLSCPLASSLVSQ